MTSVSKIVYINKLPELVKHNNDIIHIPRNMKSIDVKPQGHVKISNAKIRKN